MKTRDIGEGAPYSLQLQQKSVPFFKAALKSIAYFFIFRHHELKHTPNVIQGYPPMLSYIIFFFSVTIPYRYRHQLTSASLLTLATYFKNVPVQPTPKLKFLILPCLYLSSYLGGQAVIYISYRLRQSMSVTRTAARNALLLYSILRTEGNYPYEIVMRGLKPTSST